MVTAEQPGSPPPALCPVASIDPIFSGTMPKVPQGSSVPLSSFSCKRRIHHDVTGAGSEDGIPSPAARCKPAGSPTRAPSGGLDVSQAAVQDKETFDKAMETWKSKLAGLGGDGKTSVQITFTPGIGHTDELKDKLKAMKISIAEDSAHGLPSSGGTPPMANLGGNQTQPCYMVVYRYHPLSKVTMQLNTRRRSLTIKGKKNVLVEHAATYVAFFGAPVGAAAAATAASVRAKAGAQTDALRSLFPDAK